MIKTIIFQVLVPLTIIAADLSESRKWTGQSGTVFEATFVEERDDETVVFKKSDGSPMRVYAKQLSGADRELIEMGKTRTWTSRSGATIEGMFVSENFGKCQIKKEDGSIVQVMASQLSASEQDFVKQASSLDLYFNALNKARGLVGKASTRTLDLALNEAVKHRPDDIALVFLRDEIEAATAPSDKMTIN